jgi:hypothetical protein
MFLVHAKVAKCVLYPVIAIDTVQGPMSGQLDIEAAATPVPNGKTKTQLKLDNQDNAPARVFELRQGAHAGLQLHRLPRCSSLPWPVAEVPLAAAEYKHPFSLGQRRYMVVLFCLTASLLYADQNLLAPNVRALLLGTPLARLTDTSTCSALLHHS